MRASRSHRPRWRRALAGALGGAAPAGASSCKAGVKNVSGGFLRTFRGPATVSVKVAGRTFRLSQGDCESASGYLAVNIGVFSSVQRSKSKPNYFGLDVGRVPGSSSPPVNRDGTYKGAVVMTVVYGGNAYSLIGAATTTLSGNRSRGTVSGSTLTRQPISANFQC